MSVAGARTAAGVTRSFAELLALRDGAVFADYRRVGDELARLVEAHGVDADHPGGADRAAELDAQSFAAWVDAMKLAPEARFVVEQANTSLYNAELSDLSLLFILQQVAAAAEIPASASETMRVAGGNATLPTAIAAELGAAMITDAPVTAVRRRDNLVFVTARGEEHTGAHVVIAAPPPAVRNVQFDPPLPPAIAAAIAGLDLGGATKVVNQVRAPFWRDAGESGYSLSDLTYRVTWDATDSYDAPAGLLTTYTTANNGRTLAALGDDDRIARVRRELAVVFPEISAQLAGPAATMAWSNEPFTGGGYALYKPGQVTAFWEPLRAGNRPHPLRGRAPRSAGRVHGERRAQRSPGREPSPHALSAAREISESGNPAATACRRTFDRAQIGGPMSKAQLPKRMSRRIRPLVPVAAGCIAVGLLAAPAVACGGLVGENGTIQLTRTTTLAAYHNGVERYVTSFEFTGKGKEVGSIVPLPAVPPKVDARRRLDTATAGARGRTAGPRAVRVRRRGQGEQCAGPGHPLHEDRRARHHRAEGRRHRGRQVGDRPRVPAHARRARDARLLRAPQPDLHGRALRRDPRARLGQNAGDGTPIMVTMKTDAPWVPLRILSLGLGRSKVVQADVFLLTDDSPKLLAGGRGLSLDRNEPANASLLSRPALRQGDGVDPARDVVHVPEARCAGADARLRPRRQREAGRGPVASRPPA